MNDLTLRYFSPGNNFGSTRASRITVDSFGIYDDSEVVWQEDVYRYALAPEKILKILRVVDLGCGSGIKSSSLTPENIELVLVDAEDLRTRTERQAHFIECDFSSFHDLAKLEANLSSTEPTLYILSDVLEHLIDPRPVLRMLRKLLRQNSENRLILSTPNADKTIPRNHPGPPENERHVREWSEAEIVKCVEASGFQIEDVKAVKQNKFDEFNKTTLLEISCTDLSYLKFLRDNGINEFSQHLVFATEHAKTGKSGGIGSYFEYLTKNSNLHLLFLFCGNRGIESNPIQTCQTNGWIHTRQLVQREVWPSWDQLEYEEVLDAVLQLIFLVDTIKIVEYPEYTGIGYRVAQASRTRLLPPDVKTICYCHGSNFYIDNGFKIPSTERPNVFDLRERVTIENSDFVLFPSEFLRNLYINEQGLNLSETILSPYPISLAKLENQSIDYQYLDTIIFYGKDNTHKGFPLFIETLEKMSKDFPELIGRIKTVILAGVAHQNIPSHLNHIFNFESFQGSRVEALEMLKKNSTRAVVILPYLADNQPIAIYEVVQTGSRFISLNAGGIPEQIRSDFSEKILTEPNSEMLLDLLLECFNESSWTRWTYVSRIHGIVSQNLTNHISNYQYLFSNLLELPFDVGGKATPGETTAVLLVWTIEDLRSRLSNLFSSTRKFSKILIVTSPEIEQPIVEEVNLVSAKVINVLVLDKQLINWQEEALKVITTNFAVFLDGSNRITNDFLQFCETGMSNDVDISCLIPFSYLADNKRFNDLNTSQSNESPVGIDLITLFQAETISNTAIFWRVSSLKSLKTIPANLNSTWRLRFIMSGLLLSEMKVQIIPAKLAISSVNFELASVDTLNEFQAWNTFVGLLNVPKNEKYGFVRLLFASAMNSPLNFFTHSGKLYEDYDKSALINLILQLNTEKSLILNSRTWRYSRRMRNSIDFVRRLTKLN